MKIKSYNLFLESFVSDGLDEMALKKVKIAVMNIINKYPFLAGILFNLTLAESSRIPTMATDGMSIFYNPKFTNSLTLNETIWVLCHECMHNVLYHFNRMNNHNHDIYNQAGDYAINLLLDDIGERPKNVLYDKKYLNLSTEEIYAMLMEKEKQKPKCPKCNGQGGSGQKQDGSGGGEGQGEGEGNNGQGGGQGGGKEGKGKDKCPVCGKEKGEHGEDNGEGGNGEGGSMGGDVHKPGSLNPQPDKVVYEGNKEIRDAKNEDELNKIWKDAINNAIGRQQGSHIPDGLNRFINSIKVPEINWKLELKRFIQQTYNKISSYSIPNRRYVHRGMYLPGVKKDPDEFNNAVIIIDTSGSIQQEELNQFSAELNAIYDAKKTDFQINTSYVIWCDSEVRRVQEFSQRDKFNIQKLKPAGGGGTSFIPPFKWINENIIKKGKKPCFVIYFTDTYGTPPKRDYVSYHDKVMWLIIGGANGDNIDFGKKIQLTGRIK